MSDSQDILALSDEEFLAGNFSEQESVETEEVSEESTESLQETPATNEAEQTVADEPEESEAAEPESEAESTEAESDEATDGDAAEEDAGISAEELKRVLAPFKANGGDFQVQNVDEAIKLMQMGANYHKKMAALKPNLKSLRLLEQHNLLDADRLNYLIDLGNKNPEAIKRLVQESGIDPLDMDEAGGDYTPTSYSVDDRQMAVEEVLESIKDTPTYNDTISTITGWDESSRNTLAENPSVIATLNEHKASGVFDEVMAAVNRARVFGQLEGLTDLQAYKEIGDQLYANPTGTSQANPVQANEVKEPAPSKPDPKTVSRKRAASSPRSRSTTATPAQDQFNPLSLSDEEFAKQFSL
jgi:rRNA maturation endonuclease Nob1